MSTLAIAWMNRVLTRISRRHDFKELQKTYSASTIASQKTYGFPSNYKIIVDLKVIDGYESTKLILVLPPNFDKVIPYPEDDTEDKPVWYVPFGLNFELYPIPDTAYTLNTRAVIKPTTITATTDTLDYTDDKDDIIFAGMMTEGFYHLQMYEDALFWEKEFLTRLAEAISVEEHIPDYVPIGKGYSSKIEGGIYIGEYWNQTDVFSNP